MCHRLRHCLPELLVLRGERLEVTEQSLRLLVLRPILVRGNLLIPAIMMSTSGWVAS
ncbi:hypothetical protein FIBSPDRAFT_874426 [Athelia psychrophila]|uniref:Uncharacterized protein n=1 Tax=Athelia psychrophila TaxID=1759441 RepID=A0A165XJI6_9AGAM|nr:hypothetical protein FIBSPDRAFT_874426 [Fibularhizoctonia sp. CBS 109695]